MRLLISLCVICALFGCAEPLKQGVVATAQMQSEREIKVEAGLPVSKEMAIKTYLISVGDELDIRFPDKSELNESTRVRPDGKISLPLIGTIQAEGLAPEQFELNLRARYAELAEGSDASSAIKKYLIAVNDELEIRFANQPDLTQLVKVRPDGKISLNLVKTITAEGKTPEELESELVKKYQVFLKKPELVVIVKTFSSNLVTLNGKVMRVGMDKAKPVVILKSYVAPQIYIGGEVAKPGVVAYRSPLTLMQAVIEAGGNKPSGEMRSVIVLRKVGTDTPTLIRRNLLSDQIDATSNDIYLQPSDIIIVPKTSIASAAEFLDQNLYQLFPVFRNSAFNFAYNLTPTTTIQNK